MKLINTTVLFLTATETGYLAISTAKQQNVWVDLLPYVGAFLMFL